MTSLGERLGYSPDSRLLIVNCDDFGSSHAANTAIVRALSEGVATSATLMVPCAWAREAARLAEGFDVGVHLTFTAEYPGYRWRSLTGDPSLHDDDGYLPATAEAAIARATPDAIRAEGQAQIDQALAWGVDVTHIDSHMGVVQIDARLFEAYLDLAVEYALPLRMVGEGEDGRLGFHARGRAHARGVIYTDHFLYGWGQDTRRFLEDRVPKLRPGVSEAFGHPVDDGAELRGYDLEMPDVRVADGACFTDPAMAALIVKSGVTLLSYRPLRDLQRATMPGS